MQPPIHTDEELGAGEYVGSGDTRDDHLNEVHDTIREAYVALKGVSSEGLSPEGEQRIIEAYNLLSDFMENWESMVDLNWRFNL